MNMSIKAWNDEQEAELTRLYLEEEIKDVHELAAIFEKGYRSVISKLVQLKIYEKPELDEELEEILGVEVVGTNLNKKENLSKLLEAIKKKIG